MIDTHCDNCRRLEQENRDLRRMLQEREARLASLEDRDLDEADKAMRGMIPRAPDFRPANHGGTSRAFSGRE